MFLLHYLMEETEKREANIEPKSCFPTSLALSWPPREGTSVPCPEQTLVISPENLKCLTFRCHVGPLTNVNDALRNKIKSYLPPFNMCVYR